MVTLPPFKVIDYLDHAVGRTSEVAREVGKLPRVPAEMRRQIKKRLPELRAALEELEGMVR